MKTLANHSDRTKHFPTEDAEKDILGLLLFCPRTIGEAIEMDLRPGEFVARHHEAIYAALLELHSNGLLGADDTPIEVAIVHTRMRARQTDATLALHGHDAYLLDLQNRSPPGVLGDYISIVKRLAIEREAKGTREQLAKPGLGPERRSVLATRLRELQAAGDELLMGASGWPDPQPLPDAAAVPPWPDDALPPPIAAIVDAVADSLQVPRDLAGMVALGVMSACFAGKVNVRPFGDYCEPLSVYAVAAADVGERKSATYAQMERPLRVYEKERREELAPQWSDYEADRGRLDAQLAHAIARNKGKRDDDEGEEEVRELRRKRDALARPPRADFITSDTTAEGLARLMSDTGGHACLMSPEGGGIFDQLVGRYDKMPNLDVFLKAYDAERIAVTRANREREYPPIEVPTLVMVITTQPATLQRLATRPELRERGLLARMIYAVPGRSMVGYRRPIGSQIPAPLRDAYHALITWALRLERPEVPHELTFGPEALEAYKVLHIDIEARLRPDGALCDLPGWGNKLMGKIVRLAALFHLMSRPDDREPWRIPLSLEAFQQAARLTDYLSAHARRALGLMHESRELRAARKLMIQLSRDRKAHFTTREAHRIIGHNDAAADVRRVLGLLDVHGHIARATAERSNSERWLVHPSVVAGWSKGTASPQTGQAGTVGTLP